MPKKNNFKPKRGFVDIDLFGCKVHFIQSVIQDVESEFSEILPSEDVPGINVLGYDGKCRWLDNSKSGLSMNVVWISETAGADILAHELYHCVCNICEQVGVKDDEETRAYMLGYLFREINKSLKLI